jgi:hypothetical protein
MKMYISTINGHINLHEVYDDFDGSLIEVYDYNDKIVGDFNGSLNSFSDEELISEVERRFGL